MFDQKDLVAVGQAATNASLPGGERNIIVLA